MNTGIKENGRNMRLQPSEDLRRPDAHGQLPHLIMTTYPDRPLNELQIDDVLEINWTGVETAVRDAVVRVKHEGDLSSPTVNDTLRLIGLALRKLEMEDAECQRRMARHPGVGLLGWLTALTPTAIGMELRKIIRIRRDARRKSKELSDTQETLFELRIKLAKQVDDKIDALLQRENEEYRELSRRAAETAPVRETAKKILAEIEELEEIVESLASDNNDGSYSWVRENRARGQIIEDKYGSFLDFCAKHCDRTNHSGQKKKDWGGIEVRLTQLVAELDADAEPFERCMAAMRDERKREIYGRAETAALAADDA